MLVSKPLTKINGLKQHGIFSFESGHKILEGVNTSQHEFDHEKFDFGKDLQER